MKRLFWFAILMFYSWAAHAGLVVIVNTDSKIDHLSHDEVINIFMGRYRKLPDGTSLQPLDIGWDTEERRDFYQKLLDKNLAEVNAYWARLVFSGRTSPPMNVPDQRAVVKRVAHDPEAIGYVDRKILDNRVKVVYALPD